ncbi:hypothetical protein FOMPIDRAFT_126697 [Fomitopsis schrenkii]|uniref:Uncharacterized protein n=1 Tax=Fomitopsis schrenkii TaxID=2126942 RepID=S8EI48_FOMSC|nr:hypothetical protein FOMPIDRAFT_126697 [Fomitopsis schrenkii]
MEQYGMLCSCPSSSTRWRHFDSEATNPGPHRVQSHDTARYKGHRSISADIRL